MQLSSSVAERWRRRADMMLRSVRRLYGTHLTTSHGSQRPSMVEKLANLRPNDVLRYLRRRMHRCRRSPLLLLLAAFLFLFFVSPLHGPLQQHTALRRFARDLSSVSEASSNGSGYVRLHQSAGGSCLLRDDDDEEMVEENELGSDDKFRGCTVHLLYFGSSRLGNLLIKYSMLFAFRSRYNINVYLTNEQASRVNNYFHNLSISTVPAEYKSAKWHFTWYKNLEFILPCPENIGRKLPCFPNNPTEHCIVVADWPPDNGYPVFTAYIQQLIQEFTFKQSVQQKVHQYLQHVSGDRSDATVVGVHVRATDQNTDFVNNYGRSLPSAQYFRSALAYFRSMYSHVVFVVATDDSQYAVKNVPNHFGDVFYTSEYEAGVDPVMFDVAVLASSNHTVISVGTFGFWASLLSGGTVVAPSRFVGSDSSEYDLEIKRWDRQSEWFTWS